jgi:hypothetical protein
LDKFGIFKLLNSFYDYYLKNKDGLPPIFNSTEQKSADFPVKENPPDSSASSTPTISTKSPLQNSMLSTMKTHDEILRRVIASANKT